MNLSKLLSKEERINYSELAEHHPAVIKLYAENMRLHKKLEAAYVVASGEAVNWKEVGSKIADGVKKKYGKRLRKLPELSGTLLRSSEKQ